MKTPIYIPNAPKPIAPYSQAIKAGGFVFVSGQIPIDPHTGTPNMTTIQEATTQVLDNIDAVLKAASLSLENIVKCQIFLKDMNDFSAMNEVYATYFPKNPPARECVQVGGLPNNATIEISCIAVAD